MALTITPAVGGATREWLGSVAAYLAGTTLGVTTAIGTTTLISGVASSVVSRHWIMIGAGVMVVSGILRDLRVSTPVPYRRRQVPEEWREKLPPRVAAFAFGAVLGFGFATLFTSSAELAVVTTAPLLSSVWVILGVCVTLALAKGLVLLVPVGARDHREVLRRAAAANRAHGRAGWARRTASVGASLVILACMTWGAIP